MKLFIYWTIAATVCCTSFYGSYKETKEPVTVGSIVLLAVVSPVIFPVFIVTQVVNLLQKEI